MASYGGFRKESVNSHIEARCTNKWLVLHLLISSHASGRCGILLALGSRYLPGILSKQLLEGSWVLTSRVIGSYGDNLV